MIGQIDTTILGNCLAISSKGEHRFTLRSNNSTPSYMCYRNIYIYSPEDTYSNVHSSTIHTLPILESTQISNNRMNKLIVVYSQIEYYVTIVIQEL